MSYKKIRIGKGKTRDEHRIIMESFVKRKLDYNEIVHHKDGNKLNNNLENLEIISRSNHMKLHILNGDIKHEGFCSEENKIILTIRNATVDEKTAKRIKYKNESPEILINELKISKFTISRIRSGKSWKHI
jgi:hypothetical protein